MTIAASVAFLPVGVEQVHRVDDHRRVGGVLARRVGELLDGLDRLGEQVVLPALQVVAGPVAVRALDVGGAVLGDLGQQRLGDRGLGVVRVDEHGQLDGALIGSGHGESAFVLRCSAAG
jgi:hypothetical protein